MNTHYGLLIYIGDLDGDYDGRDPEVKLIAQGDEAWCWQALQRWTATHGLRPLETAEVVKRDPKLVQQEADDTP
jgi:hypothetical protein